MEDVPSSLFLCHCAFYQMSETGSCIRTRYVVKLLSFDISVHFFIEHMPHLIACHSIFIEHPFSCRERPAIMCLQAICYHPWSVCQLQDMYTLFLTAELWTRFKKMKPKCDIKVKKNQSQNWHLHFIYVESTLIAITDLFDHCIE